MSSIVGNMLGGVVGELLGLRSSVAAVAGLVTGTTKAQLATGSMRMGWVVAIEGCPYLLTDGNPDKAVAAWTNTGRGADWKTAIGGLFVDLDNQQKADPWEPFQSGGTCTLHVVDADGEDRFGIDTHRSLGGAITQLTETLRRNDTVAHVKGGSTFGTGPEEIFCGTECIEYFAKTGGSTAFALSRRGKYAPFQSAATTLRWVFEDGDWIAHAYFDPRYEWAQQHRVGFWDYATQLEPTISEIPRVWPGRWTGVWMHKRDVDGNMNSRDDAQLVFAGKLTTVKDDGETGCTVVQLRHILDVFKESTVMRDQFKAQVSDGMYFDTTMTFAFEDSEEGGSDYTADPLVVVASGASGPNQMNAGSYTGSDFASIVNTWLASELAANRIWGSYTLVTPEDTGSGPRTVMHWSANGGSGGKVSWFFAMPPMIGLFLGIIDHPQLSTVVFSDTDTPVPHSHPGSFTPYRVLLGQDSSLNQRIGLGSFSGGFADQYDWIPQRIKNGSPAATQGTDHWGIFLVDGKFLLVGAVVDGEEDAPTELHWCWPIGGALVGTEENVTSFFNYGRTVDDDSPPLEVKQIAMIEGDFATILKQLVYSTGEYQYNDNLFDVMPAGWGIGIPGDLLGQQFEDSIDALPMAQESILLIVPEPKRISDLFGAEMKLRGAYPCWKDQHLVFRSWQAPTSANAVALLSEDNKAIPSGDDGSQRAITELTDQFVRNIVKIDYDRDITASGEGTGFQDTYIVEDRVSIDDSGGEGSPETIEASNTYSSFDATGEGVEDLIPNFVSMLPLFSRASRIMKRTIDMTMFEGVSIGDVVSVEDSFARDPETGERGLTSRPAIVVRHRWSPGGLLPGSKKAAPVVGEVDVMFFSSTASGTSSTAYALAPSARVDELATNAGYDAGAHALTCRQHEYSVDLEAVDASHFEIGDHVLIVEIDPADEASALSWQRVISNVVGDVITLSAALSSPAWDATKLYMITYDHYSACQASQQALAFQADSVDGQVEDEIPAEQWGGAPSGNHLIRPTPPSHTQLAQLVASASYGDGKAYDVGHVHSLARTIDNLIDHKTAPSAPGLCKELQLDVTGTYKLWGVRPVFLQPATIPNGMSRSIWLRPIFRSTDGTPVTVRVTLCRQTPNGDSMEDNNLPLLGKFFEWSTSSTTDQIGDEAEFSIALKGFDGIAYIWIEGTDASVITGLAQGRVTERQ